MRAGWSKRLEWPEMFLRNMRVLALAVEGRTSDDIAQEVGSYSSAVSVILRQAGVPGRPTGAYRKGVRGEEGVNDRRDEAMRVARERFDEIFEVLARTKPR